MNPGQVESKARPPKFQIQPLTILILLHCSEQFASQSSPFPKFSSILRAFLAINHLFSRGHAPSIFYFILFYCKNSTKIIPVTLGTAFPSLLSKIQYNIYRTTLINFFYLNSIKGSCMRSKKKTSRRSFCKQIWITLTSTYLITDQANGLKLTHFYSLHQSHYSCSKHLYLQSIVLVSRLASVLLLVS